MARFSSAVAPSTPVTCMSQLFPTSVMIGDSASIRARMFASSSTRLARLRVKPKAAIRAFRQVIPFAAAKNSESLGLEPGQPPSMKGIPKSSSRRAIFSLSVRETVRPSRCVPSRRVVS